ncbi:MAG: PIN domain-containing protein [Defluviitaleaceae bacterium]|nr:PIN domain-containing protein [Defluviitaleaceae bacterium]
MKVMVDTNIVVDVYQNRAGFSETSAKILKLSESKKISGFITASTVTDIYYILGRHIKDRQQLRTLVQKLLTAVALTDVLAKDVTEAFNLPMDDFEDALFAQCAKRVKADYIVTRNTTDFINSPVPAMEPDAFVNKFS